MIQVYQGKRNKIVLTIKQDGATVNPGAITRAVFRFGAYCLDTDVSSPAIELIENETQVQLRLGLVEGILPGHYVARLTVYDLLMPEGKAWPQPLNINVLSWEGCPNE